jgi:L-alanine-DL-glutamate epimerase-like enolase superfamily enzyme
MTAPLPGGTTPYRATTPPGARPRAVAEAGRVAPAGGAPAIEAIDAAVYRIPLEEPESDGTFTWAATTVVVVEAQAGGTAGLGFTYGPWACAGVVRELLGDAAAGRSAMDVPGAWEAMVRAVRNAGRPGVASMAIAAVDTALWDLKGRLLGRPVADLLGRVREEVPVYGSGGFVSMSDRALEEQLSGWVDALGIPRVKIKIGEAWGTKPERDLERIRIARRTIGPHAALFVDANGAYTRKQAVRVARAFDDDAVTWFEEPVSSDDLEGLREVRDLVAPDVAAGEYGYDLPYFARMCAAGAVDCLQVDVTRCAGITDWLRASAVAAAHGLEVSGHCAPSLHLHPAAAVQNLRHLEYFADHARAERVLFDGVADPVGGTLRPPAAPGLGLELKRGDVERFRIG